MPDLTSVWNLRMQNADRKTDAGGWGWRGRVGRGKGDAGEMLVRTRNFR